MKLLLKRRHDEVSAFSIAPLRVGNGNIFYLHASIEVDDEERQLLRKYGIDRATLSESDAATDIKNAYGMAKYFGLIAAFIMLLFLSSATLETIISWLAYIPAAWILVTLLGTYLYYIHTSELIVVNQLINGGRNLRCNTVEELLKKEIFMEERCRYLQQVLVSARSWNDKEIIEIEPLEKHEARQAVYAASKW